MHVANEVDDAPLFAAVLTPHRSLTPRGFLILMGALGGICFAAGTMLFFAGAWPVVGFLGLDVALIYWAFRANFRAAAAFELVTVTPETITVRKVSARGVSHEWSFNPLWVRLERETHEEFGLQGLFLVSRDRKIAVAKFLGPDEKASFADALATALSTAKRGPTRTVFPADRG